MTSVRNLGHRLYEGEVSVDFVGRRKRWYIISALILLVCVGAVIFRGLNFGIEFRGGAEFTLPNATCSIEQAREVADTATGGQSIVTQTASGTIGVQTESLTPALSVQVAQDLSAACGVSVDDIKVQVVGPTWGAEISKKAFQGLIVFLILVSVFLSIYFEWRMAVAAVSSLVLDLILTAGVYSLVGFEVTPSTVIGFLTILGFSLYDVVVVFDKVQENTRGITAGSNQTYAEASNLAINQTLMRSINTSLVALLPVGGLLFIGAGLLGAGTLEDLGLVLFFGMGFAIYSSLFFATPVLVALKDHEPRIKVHNQRVLSRRASLASRATPAEGGPVDAVDVESDHALAGSTPRVGARPNTKRPNAGGRGGRPGGAAAKRRN